MYLISACLLGKKCRYNGESNYDPNTVEFSKHVDYVEACPEELGGLPTPRVPCEIVGSKVVSKDGGDCTEEFLLGAEKTLEIAKERGVTKAILKSKSPSCGIYEIYDGTFSGVLKIGRGITADILEQNGIDLYSERDMELLSKNFKSRSDT